MLKRDPRSFTDAEDRSEAFLWAIARFMAGLMVVGTAWNGAHHPGRLARKLAELQIELLVPLAWAVLAATGAYVALAAMRAMWRWMSERRAAWPGRLWASTPAPKHGERIRLELARRFRGSHQPGAITAKLVLVFREDVGTQGRWVQLAERALNPPEVLFEGNKLLATWEFQTMSAGEEDNHDRWAEPGRQRWELRIQQPTPGCPELASCFILPVG